MRALQLNDREVQTVALDSRAFGPVRSFDIAGSVQMPGGTQSYIIRMSMSIAKTSMMLDARNGSGSVASFAFTAPVIAGAEFDVDVYTVRRTRREEAILLARFGEDYQRYLGRTGRFLPRLGR